MDEVMDPSLVIYGEGLFLGGLTLYIFNKIKYTIYGKKNIIFISHYFFIKITFNIKLLIILVIPLFN